MPCLPDLCCGCGTCVGLCRVDAIHMVLNERGVYVPAIEESRRMRCCVCEDVCPWNLNQKELDNFVFGIDRGESYDGVLLGNYIKTVVGHSTNPKIRWNASSGGLVTTLLVYALEKGWVDGALLTRFNVKTLEAEPFIAKTREDVLSSAGSKYIVVPAAIKLKDLLKEKGRFAVVGLPCHIQGIRKAEMLDVRLKEKIVLHFGLMCSGSMSTIGTRFLLRALKVKSEEIIDLRYRLKLRGGGWPGSFSVKLKDGSSKSIRYVNYFTVLRSFVPLHCLVCCDHTNEFSDISFGDAWLKDVKSDHFGASILISRTPAGEQLLNSARSDGVIRLKETKASDIIDSQLPLLKFKKVIGICDSLSQNYFALIHRFSKTLNRLKILVYL